MSDMHRNAMLAGYLAATRNSEDPDLRRNDEDETPFDKDYNEVSYLGGLYGIYANPAPKKEKEKTPGFTDVKNTAVNTAKQSASSLANQAITSATSMAINKINTALGISSTGTGKASSKSSQLRAQISNLLKEIGVGTNEANKIVLPNVTSRLPSFARAQFYGSSPQYLHPNEIKSLAEKFSASLPTNLMQFLDPNSPNYGSDLSQIYKCAVLFALKDMGALGALSSGSLSPEHSQMISSYMPHVLYISGPDRQITLPTGKQSKTKGVPVYRKPNTLPNSIAFSFDGDSADRQMQFVASNADAINQILGANGFYSAPLSEAAINNIVSQIRNLAGMVIHLAITPSSSRTSILSKNLQTKILQSSQPLVRPSSLDAQPQVQDISVSDIPIEETRPQAEANSDPQTTDAEKDKEDTKKKKEGMSTGAIVGISAVVLLVVGAGVYYMRNKDNM